MGKLEYGQSGGTKHGEFDRQCDGLMCRVKTMMSIDVRLAKRTTKKGI